MAYTERQQKNVDTIKTALTNAFSGRFDLLEPVIAADFVIYEAAGLPFGGVFHGIEGYVECMRGIESFWTNKTLAPPDFVPWGEDRIFMVSQFKGDIVANGKHVDMPTISVWDFKDGKISTVRPFFFDTKHIADLAAA